MLRKLFTRSGISIDNLLMPPTWLHGTTLAGPWVSEQTSIGLAGPTARFCRRELADSVRQLRLAAYEIARMLRPARAPGAVNDPPLPLRAQERGRCA